MSRKLENHHENHIDNLIYHIVEFLDPYFYKLNFTPNIITTLSLFTGLLSGYLLYKNNYLCIPLHIISYILDCSDGYFARKYKMTSQFGDYYDHFSDLTKTSIILVLLYQKNNKNHRISFVILFIVLFCLAYYHLSLQELIYNKNESSTLNLLNDNFTLDKNNIQYSRYFGTGTVNLIIIIFMFITISNTNKSDKSDKPEPSDKSDKSE